MFLLVSVIVLIIVCGIGWLLFQHSNGKKQKVKYEKLTSDFNKIVPQEWEDLVQKNQQFFVYFGRETCPTCRNFVFYLNKNFLNKNEILYYMDTEKTEQNLALKKLRESLKIDYVPTLASINSGKLEKYDEKKESISKFIQEQQEN